MNNITDKELEMLEACQSAEDWGNACDKIKGERGQAYPDDWWDKVKLSGMMDRILGRWGADSQIKSVSFKNKDDCFRYMADGRDSAQGSFDEKHF